jgi:hypothetical protein
MTAHKSRKHILYVQSWNDKLFEVIEMSQITYGTCILKILIYLLD